MRLSIVVPSYNAERFLDRCLGSLADPRFQGRLEVIVVDDGSTDGTRSIAERFAAEHPGIFRVISQPNAGHGGAVNTGVDAARGEYFRIVDADDWVDPDALARLLGQMEALAPDVFLDERTEVYENTGAEKRLSLPADAPVGRVTDFAAVTGPEYYTIISMHALTPRTELLRSGGIRLMEHTYYVDMQFIIGIACFARTVALLRLGVYRYRLGAADQSVNPANYARNYAQHDRVLKACAAFCRENAERIPEGREEYLRTQLALLTNTQYNIALIYNSHRREGGAQARELTRWLGREYPWLKRATRRRRVTAWALHTLGVDHAALQRLKAAFRR